jgi:hypothetical protein
MAVEVGAVAKTVAEGILISISFDLLSHLSDRPTYCNAQILDSKGKAATARFETCRSHIMANNETAN